MQMKKYLLFLVTAMLATIARAADGDIFTYQGLKFRITSEADRTVAVFMYNEASGHISIPSFAINGSSRYFVTELAGSAFRDCSSLTSVSIPNSVTKIGNYAFNGCSSLTSVSIPNSVTQIGKDAFSDCRNLTSVNIPDAITQIEPYAFNNCSSLTSINIPASVTQIGEDAFAGCTSLTSVSIPASVTQIGESAFSSCSSLSEIVVENGNPNYISEDGVLFNINKTELIQCPGGKKGEYSIPTSVNKICNNAFSSCSSLTSVSIPNSVTQIGNYAFGWCSNLTSVSIPNSVTQIEESAFYSCSSLTSVSIPNSVTQIGNRAFMWCTSLTSISIPNSVTQIGENAFAACTSLTSVSIPNSVTQIGFNAFNYCASLTSVSIPNSVTQIGAAAFSSCHSLTWVSIPNSVTTIRSRTFGSCKNLKTIYVLNPKPQSVDEDAFEDVPEDAIIYIPKGSYNDYFLSSDWIHFSDFREMGAFDIALSEQTLELTAGNTATVTATVTKDDDMTIKSEEWSSSNPEVATVDNGVITAVAPGEAVIWFTAVDGYGVPHTEACKVTVSESDGVAEIVTDADVPVDVYNLQGVAVLRNAATAELRNLPAGIYIVRQGNNVEKIAVK